MNDIFGSGSDQGSGDWPLPAFYFTVKINGCDEDIAFQEVSGIESSLKTEPYIEGGSNHIYHLPTSQPSSNLTLKRAITSQDSKLIQWCNNVMQPFTSNSIKTSTIEISLMNVVDSAMFGSLFSDQENYIRDYEPCITWIFFNTYPVKVKVDNFNAMENKVAIEEIELCYSRMKRKYL